MTILDQQLKDRVAIITGAANGIGKATAQLFAKHGAKVVVADINESDGKATVAEIIEGGGEAVFAKTDVSSVESINQMVETAQNTFQQLNIMVNNAGILADAQLVKMTPEQWLRVIDINLKGVFLGGQAAAKAMIAQGEGGVILNTSSVVALYGNFGQSNYVATKAGVIGMTKVWSRELGKHNIRVNAVAPGFIETEILKDIPEKIIELMKNKTQLKRMGKPEDIANAYLFLASDNADYITGTVLSVDGGVVT